MTTTQQMAKSDKSSSGATFEEQIDWLNSILRESYRTPEKEFRAVIKLDVVGPVWEQAGGIRFSGIYSSADGRRALLRCKFEKDWASRSSSDALRHARNPKAKLIKRLRASPRIRLMVCPIIAEDCDILFDVHWMGEIFSENGIFAARREAFEVAVDRCLSNVKLDNFHEAPSDVDFSYKSDILELPDIIHVIGKPGNAGIDDIVNPLEKVNAAARIPIEYHFVSYNSSDIGAVICEKLQNIEAEPGGDRPFVLVARGGGGIAEFSYLDNLGLIKAVKDSPLTIGTALGHNKNYFPLDCAADYSFSTPTAAANALKRAIWREKNRDQKAAREEECQARVERELHAQKQRIDQENHQKMDIVLAQHQEQIESLKAQHGAEIERRDDHVKKAAAEHEEYVSRLRSQASFAIAAVLVLGLVAGFVIALTLF